MGKIDYQTRQRFVSLKTNIHSSIADLILIAKETEKGTENVYNSDLPSDEREYLNSVAKLFQGNMKGALKDIDHVLENI